MVNKEFTSEYIIRSQYVEPGLKCWFSNGWFTVIQKNIIDTGVIKFVRLKVIANFKGKATLDLPWDYELSVSKASTLGHKHRHLWTNDSSTGKPYINTHYK